MASRVSRSFHWSSPLMARNRGPISGGGSGGRISSNRARDRRAGRRLFRWLPQGRKTRRRRFGRQWLGGQRGRSIAERPAIVDRRTQVGHWEIDTIVGPTRACMVTAVERATGYTVIGKLATCTARALVVRLRTLLGTQPQPVRTITAD